jgi:gamma-glutamylcyclotransferase (GGCT)/AIG2-like uncharacterized protein YtfP
MPTTKRPLFVYGTLRDPDVLLLVLGHLPDPATVVTARALDCRCVYYPGRTYPALLQAPGETAPGTLLTALTGADIAALDSFEGEEYSRRSIEIIVNSVLVTADVYWPVATISPDAESWSLPVWVARHKAAFMATETQSVAELRRRPVARDPNEP